MTDEACREAFDAWREEHHAEWNMDHDVWAQTAWEAFRAAWTARAGRGDVVPGSVKLPTTPDEAVAMNLVSERYLRLVAPERLAHRSPSDREAALEEAARAVCWFDWHGNDEDAVRAIDKLRSALMVRP